MKRKLTDWISLALFVAVAVGIVWIFANSGPVAELWPAAK